MTDVADISIRREGSRLEIRFERADKKNALTVAMYAAIADAMAEAEADPAIKSVLFSGAGPAFCAGNDLMDFMRDPPTGDDAPVGRFLSALAGAEKVLVAAVQGPAVGVGATMLLHCDHVVVADGASLAFAFTRMALVPEAASSLLLPRVVGRLKAAELLLTGAPVPAADAVAIGLASRMVSPGEELAAARAFCDRLDPFPAEALKLTKRLYADVTGSVQDRIVREGTIFRARLASPDFAEAASAFMERRPPRFG